MGKFRRKSRWIQTHYLPSLCRYFLQQRTRSNYDRGLCGSDSNKLRLPLLRHSGSRKCPGKYSSHRIKTNRYNTHGDGMAQFFCQIVYVNPLASDVTYPHLGKLSVALPSCCRHGEMVGLGTGAQRQYKFYWLRQQPVYWIRSVGGAFLRDLVSLEHKKLVILAYLTEALSWGKR